MEFFTAAGRWRCTDVGSRVIVAISLEAHEIVTQHTDTSGQRVETRAMTDDPSWHAGPPYAIVEHVFDEYAIEDCYPTAAARLAALGE